MASANSKTKKDTLVIIGNGFDLWQGLKTSYKNFYNYYRQHRFEICKKLKIHEVTSSYGNKTFRFTPVELIYGAIDDHNLGYFDFWNAFEDSLGFIDAYELNMLYGKEPEDLNDLLKVGENAQKILNYAFSNWVYSLKIENQTKSNIRFKDNCLFINFNYTPTLETLFSVPKEDVIHIHGVANDRESLIFGHSIHPHKPENFLQDNNSRFYGLYIIEKLLYETDKHARANITKLMLELLLAGVKLEDIKEVYVLGHSLGSADFEYFRYLKSITSSKNEYQNESKINLKNYHPAREAFLRLQYAIKKYGGDYTQDDRPTKAENLAIKKKFLFDKRYTDAEIMQSYLEKISRVLGKDLNSCKEIQELLTTKVSRKQDATWHISCFTPESLKNAETLMKNIHCQNYKLYNSIDDTIKNIIAD